LEHFLLFFSPKKNTLLHSPHYNAPIFWRGKLILTIHDIAHIDCPEASPGILKIKYAKFLIRTMSRKATLIITNSNFTKSRIIEVLRINEKKIRVIHFGPGLADGSDINDFPVVESLAREQQALYHINPVCVANKTTNFHKVPHLPRNEENFPLVNIYKQSLTISKPYMFFVGNFKAHKNIPRLVQAFDMLIKEKGKSFNFNLVLVGKKQGLISPDRKIEETLKNLIGKNRILITDLLDDSMLCRLYKNAHLLVQPSIYEGFGFPPIEALAFGVPVVSSNTASLPEILGDAALFFDPFDVNEMAQKIHLALTNAKIRKELIEKGKRHVQHFSWHKCAMEHAQIYREICEA
jgi:glycosyltransferase involved in cell wall biosynthesis